MSKKIKILFFASNPNNVSRLMLDEEARSINEKIRSSKYRDSLDLITRWAVRPDDLLQELNIAQPEIVHFSGHGTNSGELILMDDLHQPQKITTAALKALFLTMKDNIKLVVLSACYSREQALAISESVDCVIGMNSKIGDRAAIIFSASFYRAIGFGRSVLDSFQQGKTSLMLEGVPEEDIPELIVRPGVDPTEINLINRSSLDSEDSKMIFPQLENLEKRKYDWGQAPEIRNFFGRTRELKKVRKWILEENSKLIMIVGLRGIGKTRLALKLGNGGVGKTRLSVKLAQDIQSKFEYIVWRSLSNSPTPNSLFQELIKILSDEKDLEHIKDTREQISRILYYLGAKRCLIILDNVESILEKNSENRSYLKGYEEYGDLFRQVGETQHLSCLMLTGREKPADISYLETQYRKVHCLELGGLSRSDARRLVESLGNFKGKDTDWTSLIDFYNGNPLALELAAKHIKEVFFGDISSFLEKGRPIFMDMKELLNWHYERLTDKEREVMFWLASNREPTSYQGLQNDLVTLDSRQSLSSTIQSLLSKIPIEKHDEEFYLQPVLNEYTTERFIEIIDDEIKFTNQVTADFFEKKLVNTVIEEITTTEFHLLASHALIKASSRDYVRDSQIRMILAPICEKLIEKHGVTGAIQKIKNLISFFQKKYGIRKNYAAGNLINMLIKLNADLTSFDFSRLYIKQVNFRDVSLINVDFRYSEFNSCIFAETFGSVLSVSISKDELYFAAGLSNGEVRIWETSTAKLLQVLKGHTDWVWAVDISKNGMLLASGGEDKVINIWDVNSGNLITKLSENIGWVRALKFSPDTKLLAIGSDNNTISTWDVEAKRFLGDLFGHTGPIWCVAFNKGGNILITGSADKFVKVWDIKNQRCLFTLGDHSGWVRSVDINDDQSIIAAGDENGTVWFWDARTGKKLYSEKEHTGAVRSIKFLNNKILVSAGNDGVIKYWNIDTGYSTNSFHAHESRIWSLDLSGETIVSGSEDQFAKIWKASTDRCIRIIRGKSNTMWTVRFDSTGNYIVSGSADGSIRFWDLESGQLSRVFSGHDGWVWSLDFSQSGDRLVSCSNDKSIRVWNVQTGECIGILRGHQSWVRWVSLNPQNEKILASCGGDNLIFIWDLNDMKEIKKLSGHLAPVRCISYSSDGSLLASASDDKTVRIWETNNWTCIQVLEHPNWVRSVSFVDNNSIVCGCGDASIYTWNITDATAPKKLYKGHTSPVRTIATNNINGTFASGSSDQTVRIWDKVEGETIVLNEHANQVCDLAFLPKKNLLASCSADETIKIWDTNKNKCTTTLRVERVYEGMLISNCLGLNRAQITALSLLGAKNDSDL